MNRIINSFCTASGEDAEKLFYLLTPKVQHSFYTRAKECLEKKIGHIDIAEKVVKIYNQPIISNMHSVIPKEIINPDYDLLVGQFHFLPGEKKLIETIELQEKPEIMIYGKVVHQRRDVQFFSDEVSGYTYSGRKAESKKLTPELKSILNRVNRYFGDNYNGILINRYNDGSEYISSHRDNERELGRQGVIAISVGATRTFRIRNLKKEVVFEVPLKDGEIIVMAGKFQNHFYHEVPVEKRVRQARTSLTFRSHMI